MRRVELYYDKDYSDLAFKDETGVLWLMDYPPATRWFKSMINATPESMPTPTKNNCRFEFVGYI